MTVIPATSRASAVAHFYNPAFTFVERREFLERFVESHQVGTFGTCGHQRVVQAHVHYTAAALSSLMAAGVIDQNLAHDPRGHGEKVRPAVPFRRTVGDQPQVRFMDQGRRLQSVVGPLVTEIVLARWCKS